MRQLIKAFKGKDLMAVGLSDSQVFFNLSRINLPPGVYEVRVNLSGYQELRAQVTAIGEKTTLIDLKLKKE